MAKSLRDLIRRPVGRRELVSMLAEIDGKFGEPDTGRELILKMALTEVGLERHLRARMRRLSSEDADALFGPNGSFGGVAAKIRGAYALGIIGPMTRSDLAKYNEIRNVFAHAPYNVRFKWNRRLQSKATSIRMWRYFRLNRPKWTSEQCFVAGVALYALYLCHDRPKRRSPVVYPMTYFGYRGRALQV